ncbi:MAG: GH12 family glycosyl hydrolase domain-containing protein [Gemmatimonadota bacterium]
MRGKALTPAALMAAGAVAVAGLSAGQQAPAASVTALCRPYQYLPVRNGAGEQFIVRNDNYGGQPECLLNTGGPDFAVSGSGAASRGEPAAFPYIFLGCSWGLCTPGSGLPAMVAGLPSPRTSWHTSQRAAGSWDASYDIWFNSTPIETGQATGGELMIWLGSQHRPPPPPRTPIVRIDHARWYLHSWITHHAGIRWRLIQFRRVRPVWRVSGLRLRPFVTTLEDHGWIQPWYWLLNIEAGFEIWRGATAWPPPGSQPGPSARAAAAHFMQTQNRSCSSSSAASRPCSNAVSQSSPSAASAPAPCPPSRLAARASASAFC